MDPALLLWIGAALLVVIGLLGLALPAIPGAPVVFVATITISAPATAASGESAASISIPCLVDAAGTFR